MPRLHNRLARLYQCGSPDNEIRDIILIVPLSYATLRNKLTNGSGVAANLARAYQLLFPQAPIAFTNSIHSGFANCDLKEKEFKLKMLRGKKVLQDIPSAHNSITEAEVIRDSVSLAHGSRILVICGEMHSQRVRLIWKQVFPEMVIVIRTFSVDCEYQWDHPARLERHRWAWIGASLAGHLLTWLLGLERMRGIRHATQQLHD